MDDGSFQTTMKKILLFKKERSGPYWTGFWDGIDLKSYTRNYNNLRYNISQGLGKALPNKIPRDGGRPPKFGPVVESCSLLFSIIFLHILDFAVTSWYNTTSPKTKRNAARVGSTIGKGGMLWQSILFQKPSELYPILRRKSRGFWTFPDKILMISSADGCNRVVHERMRRP